MKKYLVSWETCYNDEFPEQRGECVAFAENEDEVKKKFNVFHAVITDIKELNE